MPESLEGAHHNTFPAINSELRTATTPSEFEAILQTALDKYPGEIVKRLHEFRRSSKIDEFKYPESILNIFRHQANALDDSKNSLMIKYIEPVTNRLHDLGKSPVLDVVARLAFPPATAIFSAIGVVLSIPSDVKGSHDALVHLFERIETFVKRVEIYTKIKQPTDAMTELVVKIMAEVISVLILADKRIRCGILAGKHKDILRDDEIRSTLHTFDQLTGVESTLVLTHVYKCMVEGRGESRDMRIRYWLFPPDPWENYDLVRKAPHRGPATWFTQGDVFQEWKAEGSLLWVNGIPASGKTVLSYE